VAVDPRDLLDILRDEVAALDELLLTPVATTPPDPLSLKERIGVRAYLVLAHGAVEDFVERCFSTYLETAAQLDNQGRVLPGVYLTMFHLRGDLEKQIKKTDRTGELLLNRLPPLYAEKVVKPNNGIRRSNIQNLCQGAGLRWLDFESTCASAVSALDTLGAKRGSVAHVSTVAESGGGVQQELYPTNVREWVGDVVLALPDMLTYIESQPTPAKPRVQVALSRLRRQLQRVRRR
jgi:RiboL-PSP-HEPN